MMLRRTDLHNLFWHTITSTSLLLFCDVATVTFNTNCHSSSDCSQGKRFPTDSYFDCSIGMFEEWKQFKNTNRILESYEHDLDALVDMNPPTISTVSFYMIADKNNIRNNPNLNLTFRLPRNSPYDTKALLVKFVGMNDPRYPQLLDPYYKDNPRYRLFNFPFYKTPEQDKTHPREIVYGCFMGLDCQSEKRVYLITLTAYTMNPSHPGSSVTYQFTVYTTRYFTPKSMKLTIAAAYIYRLRTMHVVFEPISDEHANNFTVYIVSVIDTGTGKQHTVQIEHGSPRYEHEFIDISIGNYRVEVKVQQCIGISPCPLSQSGIIEVNYQTERTSREENVFSTIYATVGVVSGLVLLIILLTCFMLSIDHRPKVNILNMCRESVHANVSTALEQCLQQHFHTKVMTKDEWWSLLEDSPKVEFRRQNMVTIVTICHHYGTEEIKQLIRKLKHTHYRKDSLICFSETDECLESFLDSYFKWSDGCRELIEHIQKDQQGFCLKRLKKCRPRLNNDFESSNEFTHFQQVIDSTKPAIMPPSGPCPIHSNRQDGIRQPLIEHDPYCPVHNSLFVGNDFCLHSAKEMNGNFNVETPVKMNLNSLPTRNIVTKEGNFDSELSEYPQENTLVVNNSKKNYISQKMYELVTG